MPRAPRAVGQTSLGRASVGVISWIHDVRRSPIPRAISSESCLVRLPGPPGWGEIRDLASGTSCWRRWRASSASAFEVGRVERRDLLPAIVGGRNAVRREFGGEECVASVVVAVELVRLVLLIEDLVELSY